MGRFGKEFGGGEAEAAGKDFEGFEGGADAATFDGTDVGDGEFGGGKLLLCDAQFATDAKDVCAYRPHVRGQLLIVWHAENRLLLVMMGSSHHCWQPVA